MNALTSGNTSAAAKAVINAIRTKPITIVGPALIAACRAGVATPPPVTYPKGKAACVAFLHNHFFGPSIEPTIKVNQINQTPEATDPGAPPAPASPP